MMLQLYLVNFFLFFDINHSDCIHENGALNSYFISFFTFWIFGCDQTGSLSKGSDGNVRSLIEAGLIQVLLSIITNPIADGYLMEICLCVVRSIYEHPFAPKEIINTNTATLNYLIGNYLDVFI